MTRENFEAVIQNKADIAEQMGDWTEDLFNNTLLQAQMIENDPYRCRVLEAQHKAVQSLRNLRRELEACKVAIAFAATPEGAKEIAEYAGNLGREIK